MFVDDMCGVLYLSHCVLALLTVSPQTYLHRQSLISFFCFDVRYMFRCSFSVLSSILFLAMGLFSIKRKKRNQVFTEIRTFHAAARARRTCPGTFPWPVRGCR